MAEFEDQDAIGFQVRGGLRDQVGVKFVPFFAAVEREFGFVVADFARKGGGFAVADIGRVGNNEVEER